MTVHIVKLSVGTETVDDLARWQAQRMADLERRLGRSGYLFHTTRMVPKRQKEVLDDGSLYWVIRGVIQARQRIVGFEEGQKEDGTRCCLILLDPELVPVRATRRRPFQGWRYLEADDAPADLGGASDGDIAKMPPKMRRDLAELCLI
jgi:hypothetical protein